MKLAFILFLITSVLFPQTIKDIDNTVQSISSKKLIETVKILCSEEFEGRLSGSEGYNKAAQFIADEFRNIGLLPFEGEDYYQYLNVEYNKIKSPVRLTLINYKNFGTSGIYSKEYVLGKDFVCRGFTGSGKFVKEVVFCGYGISLPEIGYDDYAGVNVKDKIVIIFKQNPSWNIEGKSWTSGYPRQKAKTAFEHGAAAMLLVSLPNDTKPQDIIGSVLHGEGEQNERFPQLHIDIPIADDYLEESGYTLKQLQTIIDSTKKSFSVELSVKAEIEVNAEYTKEKQTMNVAGRLEGTSSDLKNEYVIIGAHLDHVGKQGDKIYFPGANDNASGSASVLEIARAVMKSGYKPERSIIFILFASEEQGLFGSKYFINNSPVPPEKITAMLNLDCVGYGDSIQLGNGKSAPVLWNIAKEIDRSSDYLSIESTWGGGGADAGPFHDKGIPSLYFASSNSYEHLHSITDRPETLNLTLHESITKLACAVLLNAANGGYIRENVQN